MNTAETDYIREETKRVVNSLGSHFERINLGKVVSRYTQLNPEERKLLIWLPNEFE